MSGPKELREGHLKLTVCSTQEGTALQDPVLRTVESKAAGMTLDFPWTEEAHGHAGSSRTYCLLMPLSS